MTQTPNLEPDRIDLLIEQVGRFTEGLTEFRLSMTESITEFRAAMEQNTTEFRAAMEQSMNEFRADMAEIKLTTRQQAETAASQAETTAKLVAIVERLLAEKGTGNE
ncbi:MAG: hypothetical protein F6K31_37085 [Symploca sp. SIO2G7]|nr:hypothetical protein [Symploca sp. SIO2G7]